MFIIYLFFVYKNFPSNLRLKFFLFWTELMVLGFISLLLTFGQNYIAEVCIPKKYANTMLPCPYRGNLHKIPPKDDHDDHKEDADDHHRRLLWYEHRRLAGGAPVEGCKPVSRLLFSY